jgi:hypothetical protein
MQQLQDGNDLQKYEEDIGAICSFLSSLLTRTQAPLELNVPSGLHVNQGADTKNDHQRSREPLIIQECKQFAGVHDAEVSQPGIYCLPASSVQAVRHIFQSKQLVCFLSGEALGVLLDKEVSRLVRLLCWGNSPFSFALIRSLQKAVYDMDDFSCNEEHLHPLAQHVVDMLSSLRDELYEKRIASYFYLKKSLHVYLTAHHKPLLQLFCWWCSIKLSYECPSFEQIFLDEIRKISFSAVERLLEYSKRVLRDHDYGLMGGIERGSSDVLDMYEDLFIYLQRTFCNLTSI